VDDEQAAAETDRPGARLSRRRSRARGGSGAARSAPAGFRTAGRRSRPGSNSELRRLESQIAAKQLELRGAAAARLPRADLVAQYAMLAKFNNYTEYFSHFQRNNGKSECRFRCRFLCQA